MKLINADKLIEALESDFIKGFIECFDDVLGIVEAQPIAYDLDTFTKEIEKRIEHITNVYCNTDCPPNEYYEGRMHELIAVTEIISKMSNYEKEV